LLLLLLLMLMLMLPLPPPPPLLGCSGCCHLWDFAACARGLLLQ
jgi:hypothetical protein